MKGLMCCPRFERRGDLTRISAEEYWPLKSRNSWYMYVMCARLDINLGKFFVGLSLERYRVTYQRQWHGMWNRTVCQFLKL